MPKTQTLCSKPWDHWQVTTMQNHQSTLHSYNTGKVINHRARSFGPSMNHMALHNDIHLRLMQILGWSTKAAAPDILCWLGVVTNQPVAPFLAPNLFLELGKKPSCWCLAIGNVGQQLHQEWRQVTDRATPVPATWDQWVTEALLHPPNATCAELAQLAGAPDLCCVMWL